MTWWGKAGAVAGVLAALIAVTVVPVRGVPGMTVEASQTAVSDGGCGEVTLDSHLYSTGRVPLIDLWGLTRVSVTMSQAALTSQHTDQCDPDAVVTAAARIYNPECANPAEFRDDAGDESDLVTLCGGEGIQLAPWIASDTAPSDPAPVLTVPYGDVALAMGSGFTRNDMWCLDSEYGIDVATHTDDSGTLDSTNATVTSGELCVLTRPPMAVP